MNGSLIPPSPKSKNWVTECGEEPDHELRRRVQPANAPLPTRVIDVGSPEVSVLGVEGAKVGLYESEGKSAQHIALSHCWGDKKGHPRSRSPLTTTPARSKRIMKRYHGRPCQELSEMQYSLLAN